MNLDWSKNKLMKYLPCRQILGLRQLRGQVEWIRFCEGGRREIGGCHRLRVFWPWALSGSKTQRETPCRRKPFARAQKSEPYAWHCKQYRSDCRLTSEIFCKNSITRKSYAQKILELIILQKSWSHIWIVTIIYTAGLGNQVYKQLHQKNVWVSFKITKMT